MGKPDRHDDQWDALVACLRRVRGDRGLTLEDAQRCFALAPDEPFTAWEIRALVAMVVGGLASAGELVERNTATDLIFSANTLVTAGDWSGRCDVVGLYPRQLREDLVTDVNSLSIDTRRLRYSRATGDLRLGGEVTNSVVFDVWTEFNALTEVFGCDEREGGLSWDARLEVADWETLQCAVSSPTWYDFAGYGDEAVEELRRN